MQHDFTIFLIFFIYPLVFLQKRQPVVSDTAWKKKRKRIPFEMPEHRRYFLWVHWSVLSSGGLDLIGRLGVEVLPDGVVVYGSTHGDKQVPDGVSKWNDAVTFEKEHPKTVTCSAHQQLAQPRLLRLKDREELIRVGMNKLRNYIVFIRLKSVVYIIFGLWCAMRFFFSMW